MGWGTYIPKVNEDVWVKHKGKVKEGRVAGVSIDNYSVVVWVEGELLEKSHSEVFLGRARA